MSYELKGNLVEIFDTVQVSDSFKKREFVVEKVETAGEREFIEEVKFQVLQDKCSILDGYKVGDEVNVSFNIKGRKWEKEGKVSYFINLDAWRVTSVSGETDPNPIEPQGSNVDDDDQLPF